MTVFAVALSPNTSSRNMVLGQIITNDVADPRILQAMEAISRGTFVPEHLSGAANVDEDLEISPGRYLMAPLTFARLLDLAQIMPACRVLVVGCLSGYAAAIVAQLSSHVTAIDSDDTAIAEARAHIKRLGIPNVALQTVASLAAGYGASAPYHVIVVMGAVKYIPDTLGAQLAEGGRLVTVRSVALRPDRNAGLGKGLLVEKLGRQLQYREHFDASAALLPGFERKPGFVF